jgi:hypothetical protein
LYLKPGFTFIDAAGVVTDQPPNMATALARMKEGHHVVIRGNLEADWISVVSPLPKPGNRYVPEIGIGANRLNRLASDTVLDIFKISGLALRAAHQKREFRVTFLGLNKDPREVWEIPEVLAWWLDLWRAHPVVPAMLSVDSLSVCAACVCLALTAEDLDRFRADYPIADATLNGKPPTEVRMGVCFMRTELAMRGWFSEYPDRFDAAETKTWLSEEYSARYVAAGGRVMTILQPRFAVPRRWWQVWR